MTVDELLRFTFVQGSGQSIVGATVFPGWTAKPSPETPQMLATTAGAAPGNADPSRTVSLPVGTHDLLAATPFPEPVAAADLTRAARLGHALITAFGLQRREPSNQYNDHRGYPSVRSKFPVHAFVASNGRHRWLDVYRHALLDLGTPASDGQDVITLAARYSHLPPLYGRLRGALTELELGINLRALCAALEVYRVPYRVELPDAAGEARLRELGLEPTWGWTLPLTVRPWPAGEQDQRRPGAEAAANSTAPSDPLLRDVVTVNRAIAGRPSDPPAAHAAAIPAGRGGRPASSWADVLWARSSGTMPRQLAGLAARREVRPYRTVQDAIDWAAVAPPATLLRRLRQVLTVTVCLQDIDGHASGVYRLDGAGLGLITGDAEIGAKLERDYGHRQRVDVGCGVRTANATWFISVRPRRLFTELGPWTWPLAQLSAGWLVQGLCMAAAANGQYARPARAFQDIAVQRLLGLAPDEFILISITCGTARFTEPALDLRL